MKTLLLLAYISFIALSGEANAQWIESNNGIYGGHITASESKDGILFIGTLGGVYTSSNGSPWVQFNQGLDNTTVNSLAITSNNKLFVAVNGGNKLFVSQPPYTNWEKSNIEISVDLIVSLVTIKSQVFGLTKSGSLYTLASNESWQIITTGFEPINSLTTSGLHLFAGTSNGIFVSSDDGLSWSQKNVGLPEKFIFSLTSTENYQIATTSNRGVFLSHDNGTTWVNTSLETGKYKAIELNGLLIAGNEARVYGSSNNGTSWSQITTLPGVMDFAFDNSMIIAGTRFGLYRSDSRGQTWIRDNNIGLTNSTVVSFTTSSTKIFCSTKIGVYQSENLGRTWILISKGLPLDQITAMKYFENRLFVALMNYGIFYSDNDGTSWQVSTGISNVYCFAEQGRNLLIGVNNGIYVSEDIGLSWRQLPSNVSRVKGIATRGDTIFACSSNNGITTSSDKGKLWTLNNEGLTFQRDFLTSIISFRESLFVGVDNDTPIYEQKKINTIWEPANIGILNTRHILSFVHNAQNLFCGGSEGVFVTSNSTWSEFYKESLPIVNESNKVERLEIYRNHIFAGTTGNGVWVSCIEPPQPKITAVRDDSNDSTLISSSSIGNIWFLNDIEIQGATNSTLKPEASGGYTVKTILDGCESKPSVVKLVEIETYEDPQIVMPNVFTPNGDKFNQEFIPITYLNVNNSDIKINDRWGNTIYYSNSIKIGWLGENQPPGIYYYQISFKGKNGKEGKVKGWVHLIR